MNQSEVHHGCILSPILFALIIGDVFHVVLSEERGGVQLTMTSFLKHYADDMYSFSHWAMDLVQIVYSWSKSPLYHPIPTP